MEFLKKEIILANGKNCVLQSPGPKDAQKMMDYLKQTAAETYFMLRLPEEVTMTVEAEEKYLKSALEDPLSLMINAVVDGKLAGNVGLSPIAPRQWGIPRWSWAFIRITKGPSGCMRGWDLNDGASCGVPFACRTAHTGMKSRWACF